MYLDPETRAAPFDQTAITESPAYILTLSTIHFFHGVTVPSCNPASLVSFSLHISLSFTQVSPCQTFFFCVWFSFLQTKFLACQEKALHTVQHQTRWAQAKEMMSFKSHSRECVFLLMFLFQLLFERARAWHENFDSRPENYKCNDAVVFIVHHVLHICHCTAGCIWNFLDSILLISV